MNYDSRRGSGVRDFCKMTRAEEITKFAKKIGIATCVGLLHGAGIFAEIL